MRQKRTIRASSVSAKRGVWLGWAIFCSFARGDYDGPFLPRSQSTQHTSRDNLLGKRASHARLRGGGQPHARRVGGGWWGHDSQRGEIRSRVLRGRELEALIKLFR